MAVLLLLSRERRRPCSFRILPRTRNARQRPQQRVARLAPTAVATAAPVDKPPLLAGASGGTRGGGAGKPGKGYKGDGASGSEGGKGGNGGEEGGSKKANAPTCTCASVSLFSPRRTQSDQFPAWNMLENTVVWPDWICTGPPTSCAPELNVSSHKLSRSA